MMGTFSLPEEEEDGSKKISLKVREKKEPKEENLEEEKINESPFCYKCFFPLIMHEIMTRLTYNYFHFQKLFPFIPFDPIFD